MLENVDWEIVPNKITVAGEASSLETKENIILGEVDLSNLLSDTQLELEIDTPANCVNSSGIASATVSIKFINGLETRLFTVTNIAARGLSNGQNFSRITNSVDVVVRGMPEELEELTADDIRIVVDLTEYTSDGTYSVPATVLVDGPRWGGGCGLLHCGLQDHILGGAAMIQIATVTGVPAPGEAVVSVVRQSACGHDCETCAGCGAQGGSLTVRAVTEISVAVGDRVEIYSGQQPGAGHRGVGVSGAGGSVFGRLPSLRHPAGDDALPMRGDGLPAGDAGCGGAGPAGRRRGGVVFRILRKV